MITIWLRRAAGQTHNAVNAVLKSAERRFGAGERLARFRCLLAIVFGLLLVAQTLGYFNSFKCWFYVPATVERWAQWMDADRRPHGHCLVPTDGRGDAVPCNLQENWSQLCGPLAPQQPLGDHHQTPTSPDHETR